MPTLLVTLIALAAATTTVTVGALALGRRLRAASATLRERDEDLATMSRVARALATADDARVAACHAARWVTGATSVVLWEPQDDGALIATASAGTPLPHLRLAPGREPSLEVTAALTGEAAFSADVEADGRANPRVASLDGHPRAAHYEPILHDEQVAGVLAVGWTAADPAAMRRARRLLPLIALEAAESIERADLVVQLAELALTDTLTGLGNRRAWDEWIAGALQTASDPRVTVALVDIDRFKAFNDARGHQDGDRLLKEAAAAWRAHLRPGDRLARYGGEEFAVLLPGCDEVCAAIVIERLRTAMPAGQTCSAGVAEWDGHEDADTLVARADAALYAAKEAGRDRVIGAAQLPVP